MIDSSSSLQQVLSFFCENLHIVYIKNNNNLAIIRIIKSMSINKKNDNILDYHIQYLKYKNLK